MKGFLLLIVMAVRIGWPNAGDAASIKNEDEEIHLIKARITGGRFSGGRWI